MTVKIAVRMIVRMAVRIAERIAVRMTVKIAVRMTVRMDGSEDDNADGNADGRDRDVVISVHDWTAESTPLNLAATQNQAEPCSDYQRPVWMVEIASTAR
jgi:hypothetical protein